MNEFSVSVITDPFLKASKDMDRRVKRATMWGLRETGRLTKREGMRGAPRDSGALRKSIHSSKRLKQEMGGFYSVTVGPRWGSVNERGVNARLYANVAEERTGFMRAAHAKAAGEMAAIHAKAWRKAMQ